MPAPPIVRSQISERLARRSLAAYTPLLAVVAAKDTLFVVGNHSGLMGRAKWPGARGTWRDERERRETRDSGLVHLVGLVCLVYLAYLVYLVR